MAENHPNQRSATALGANPRLQSPYVYLQAAGSTGEDGSSVGIHLRWAFQRALGEGHLAKGILSGAGGPYPSTSGFNRDKDFVFIYKTHYDPEAFRIKISLRGRPGSVVESGSERSWRFTGSPNVPGNSTLTQVVLRFTDVALYNQVRGSVDPMLDSMEFLRRYQGKIEIEAPGKHLLRLSIHFVKNLSQPVPDAPYARAEAISARDRLDPETLYLACRKEIDPTHGGDLELSCEDIRHVRFQYRKSFPALLDLQTYEDYTLGAFGDPAFVWKPVAKLGLSEDDGVVKKRLNNAPHEDVDGRWPKFNETDPATGLFTLNARNYLERWALPQDGLKAALARYLALSRFDPRANDVVMDTSTEPSEAAFEISYLDVLNVVAQDFHVARMLGLGHVDNDPKTTKLPMVYLLEYVTTAPLEPGDPGQPTTHYYLTSPITFLDQRLPPVPVLRPVRYGLFHEPIEGQPLRITDAEGYTRFEPSRFVNLDREPYAFEGSLPAFWSGDPGYCLCASTLPAMYGVEYRHETETTWRRAELAHDPTYSDRSGMPETVPLPERGSNPVFTHRETEEGIHLYALYSINWFSRPSKESNIVATDFTRFPLLKSLKPPANFAVQLVQAENPLVLTTAAEQARLASLEGPDKTLVRVTFDWDQVHSMAYQFADTVELYFRERLAENVRGIVSTAAGSITERPGHRVAVRTAPGNVASQNPPEIRQPFVLPAQKGRYLGGAFVYENRAFVIDDIELPDPSGNDPTFILRQQRETQSLETDVPGEMITQERWISPEAPGRAFLAIENLDQPAAWDTRLAREVYLEPFHEVYRVRVSGSAANDRVYTLESVDLAGTQTRLRAREAIVSNALPAGELIYPRKARIIASEPAASGFRIDQDLQTGEGGLGAGMTVRVFGAPENAGTYTVTGVVSTATETIIGVDPPPPTAVASGYLGYDKKLPISDIDRANGYFFLDGDLRSELMLPRIETRVEPDGTIVRDVVGGLSGLATVTELEDVDGGGVPIPGSHTGVFEIVFDDTVLLDPADPGVGWYKGSVRLMEDAALFPPATAPNYRPPARKVLNVWEIDTSGATLRLIVFDPTFTPAAGLDPQAGPLPMEHGAGVEVNFHPGYRLYLEADTASGNAFEAATILPAAGEGNKNTLIAARSGDSSQPDCFSGFTPPAVLLAQEIREPVPPGVPSGPRFATRPDFYGKATYTFDVEVGDPFALVFYRGTDKAILDALYKPATARRIRQDLAALQGPDADFMNNRWHDLASAATDGDDLFPQYVAGGYRFPIPDNDRYVLPHADPSVVVKPFAAGTTAPGQIVDTVRTAIEGAFVPLTAQPVIVRQLKTGTATSSRSPVIRNSGGDVLPPNDPAYDPWPMAVKLPGGGKVRFTDYTLDGAALNQVFYFAVELSSRLVASERSPIAGPITLVDSSPPQAPEIRNLIVRKPNLLREQPAAVVFDLNPYPETTRIAGFEVYRTTEQAKSASVRSMEKVKIAWLGEEVLDDFAGMELPPFGDELFYRIVALRRFTNERGEVEYAPSHPSKVRAVRLIDDAVPPAPRLSFLNDPPLPGPPVTLPNVRLTWRRTAWKARYHVYKLNRLGGWVKIHSLASNEALVLLDLATTELGTNVLEKQNTAGQTIYHRFKVVTENSSGLLSREERALPI